MILYVLLIAVLNLCLGFGIAVHLSRKYQNFIAQSIAPMLGESELAIHNPNTQPVIEETPAPVEAESTTDETPITETDSNTEESVEYVKDEYETTIEDLQGWVEGYQEKLDIVDTELRTCVDTPDTQKIDACLTSLREANDEYCHHRDDMQERIAALQESHPVEEEDTRNNIQAAIEQQNTQIESCNEAIKHFDFESDIGEHCQQIVSETSKLLNTGHQIRDTLNETSVEIAKSKGSLGLVDQNDPLTGLLNRTGLEVELTAWWERDPHRNRQLSLTMIDVDEFSRINERCGRKSGDSMLNAIGELISAENNGEGKVARFAGQQYVITFPDEDIRFATGVVERIRQTIETARFHIESDETLMTVSCAVIETNANDTPDTLFKRLEVTLKEAKRYGKNRTFLHDGKYPAPVTPPNLSLEGKDITI